MFMSFLRLSQLYAKSLPQFSTKRLTRFCVFCAFHICFFVINLSRASVFSLPQSASISVLPAPSSNAKGDSSWISAVSVSYFPDFLLRFVFLSCTRHTDKFLHFLDFLNLHNPLSQTSGSFLLFAYLFLQNNQLSYSVFPLPPSAV